MNFIDDYINDLNHSIHLNSKNTEAASIMEKKRGEVLHYNLKKDNYFDIMEKNKKSSSEIKLEEDRKKL